MSVSLSVFIPQSVLRAYFFFFFLNSIEDMKASFFFFDLCDISRAWLNISSPGSLFCTPCRSLCKPFRRLCQCENPSRRAVKHSNPPVCYKPLQQLTQKWQRFYTSSEGLTGNYKCLQPLHPLAESQDKPGLYLAYRMTYTHSHIPFGPPMPRRPQWWLNEQKLWNKTWPFVSFSQHFSLSFMIHLPYFTFLTVFVIAFSVWQVLCELCVSHFH